MEAAVNAVITAIAIFLIIKVVKCVLLSFYREYLDKFLFATMQNPAKIHIIFRLCAKN